MVDTYTGKDLHKLFDKCYEQVPFGGAIYFRRAKAFKIMADLLNQDIIKEPREGQK